MPRGGWRRGTLERGGAREGRGIKERKGQYKAEQSWSNEEESSWRQEEKEGGKEKLISNNVWLIYVWIYTCRLVGTLLTDLVYHEIITWKFWFPEKTVAKRQKTEWGKSTPYSFLGTPSTVTSFSFAEAVHPSQFHSHHHSSQLKSFYFLHW